MVYFIRQGRGFIKIGYSGDVKRRLIDLQSYSPVRLQLLLVEDGGVKEEAQFHARFATLRCKGGGSGWFRPGPELLTFIAQRQPEGRQREVARRHLEYPDCACDVLDVRDGTLCTACSDRAHKQGVV